MFESRIIYCFQSSFRVYSADDLLARTMHLATLAHCHHLFRSLCLWHSTISSASTQGSIILPIHSLSFHSVTGTGTWTQPGHIIRSTLCLPTSNLLLFWELPMIWVVEEAEWCFSEKTSNHTWTTVNPMIGLPTVYGNSGQKLIAFNRFRWQNSDRCLITISIWVTPLPC